MANKSGIKIKKSHEGEFTAKAKKAGMSVQEFASHVLANKTKYPASTRKQANFAKNAKTKFKHQTGGDADQENPYGQFMNQQLGLDDDQIDVPNLPSRTLAPARINYQLANPNDIQSEQLSNPGVQYPQLRQMSQTVPQNGAPKQDNKYMRLFNNLAMTATGVKDLINGSQQKHNEQLQLLQSMTPRYMQNMESQGLDNGPAYTMYGGNGMHGEGSTIGIRSHSVGKNPNLYSMGVASDIASKRRLSDVPEADPQRWAMYGGDDRQAAYLQYGGIMDEPGYMMYGGQETGLPYDYDQMTNYEFGREGIRHQGPYGKDSVYQNGGNVTSNKAKEILRDGTANGRPLSERQKKYFGWIAGGSKAQTGGGAHVVPAAPNQEAYYQASARLAYYKDKLNGQLKAKNPQAFGDYFKGLVDQRRSGNIQGANDYVQNSQYNDYLSPDEVKKTLGSDKDYQGYMDSLKAVNNYNVAQGKQPLYGNIEGQSDDLTKLNYGRRFASLQVTPSFGTTVQGGQGGDKHYNRNYAYNPQTGNVDFTETGDLSLRPTGFSVPANQQQPPVQQGDVTKNKYGGRNRYQVGGKVLGLQPSYTVRQTGGSVYNVGDEVELTPAQIKALKKQGYKIEEL